MFNDLCIFLFKFSDAAKIFHDQTNKIIPIKQCSSAYCFNHYINYELPMFEMVDIINLSEECYQEIKFSCYATTITHHATWLDRNGKIHNFKCDCDKNNNVCFTLQGHSNCNCDAGDLVQRNDTMRITNKVKL